MESGHGVLDHSGSPLSFPNDKERAARALELLRVVAADFQVIYLTTSDRYDETADAVVVLDGPTALTPDLDPGTGEVAAGPGQRLAKAR